MSVFWILSVDHVCRSPAPRGQHSQDVGWSTDRQGILAKAGLLSLKVSSVQFGLGLWGQQNQWEYIYIYQKVRGSIWAHRTLNDNWARNQLNSEKLHKLINCRMAMVQNTNLNLCEFMGRQRQPNQTSYEFIWFYGAAAPAQKIEWKHCKIE